MFPEPPTSRVKSQTRPIYTGTGLPIKTLESVSNGKGERSNTFAERHSPAMIRTLH